MTDKGLNMAGIADLDKQIETLLSCKPLSEKAVKELCEKVSHISLLHQSKTEIDGVKRWSGTLETLLFRFFKEPFYQEQAPLGRSLNRV